MIAIIDYDAGNIKSVEKALRFLGEDVCITRDRDVILSSDRVILPGVGSFGDAMSRIREYGLVNPIYDVVEKGIPFLGICLGLQLLFQTSEECPRTSGLGLLDGRIVRIPEAAGIKIPHMGWNSLEIRPDAALFQGLPEQPYVYFVHSYYLQADHEEDVAASTIYNVKIHASVEHGNLFACQFHPEKSSTAGLQILRNFIRIGEDT